MNNKVSFVSDIDSYLLSNILNKTGKFLIA